jgi:monothiol glutaredoxin
MRFCANLLVVRCADDGVLGIKEYSEWPTIPQLYLNKEFVGGCDILVSMHQNGELAKMLEEKKVLVPAEGAETK